MNEGPNSRISFPALKGDRLMSSYMDRIKSFVLAALRNAPCTFEEITRKCFGAYPTLVQEAIKELQIPASNVSLFTTQNDPRSHSLNLEVDIPQTEMVTYQIENNPVLSNWYFSFHTCQKIAQLDLWHDKEILFLGTPRLFEYFVVQNRAKHISLIDYDKTVTDRLQAKYRNKNNVSIDNQDINFLYTFGERKYDYVFLDPPWYLESYISWLIAAAKMVRPDGNIVFPLFPFMVRPTASQERNEIFRISRQISSNVLSIPEFAEYDVPSFERNELLHMGIELRANWKVADLMVLQRVTYVPGEWDDIQVDTDYLSWDEYNWFGVRWFIKAGAKNDKTCTTMPLVSVHNNSLYLKTPSRQNPELNRVNVLSSKGHGFCVSDTRRFVEIMGKVDSETCSYSLESFGTFLETLDIDASSKNLIQELWSENNDRLSASTI